MIFDWEVPLAELTTQELYNKAMEFLAQYDALAHSQPMTFALMDELRPLWREYSHYFSVYEQRTDQDAVIKHPTQVSFDFDFSKESE